MNGKGSKPRPLSISRDDFSKRWDETFRAKKSARNSEPKKAKRARK